MNPHAREKPVRISDWDEKEMKKIAQANIEQPLEFKKDYPPRQKFLNQPEAPFGVRPGKALGIDEIYEGYEKAATED